LTRLLPRRIVASSTRVRALSQFDVERLGSPRGGRTIAMASTPFLSVVRRLARLCLIVAACAVLPDRLPAQDRMVRRYAAGQGFTGAPVGALAQDSTGFLWIGGQDGLYRYDGNEFRRWASADVEAPVRAIATTGDRLVVLTADGALLEIEGDGATPLPLPLPAGSGEPNGVAFDATGRLWAVRGGRVASLEPRGAWHSLPEHAFGGEVPRFVRTSPDGRLAIATWSGVWMLDAHMRAVKTLEFAYAPDFLFLPGGGIAAVDSAIRVVTHTGRRSVDPFRTADVRARPIALAERQGTVWASYDRFLVALRPDRLPEVIGPNHGVESGGPLLVDREGSLWMGTFSSLLQYPEPETRIWNERSGLHSQHTRFVARSEHVLWVTTWQGAAAILPDRGEAQRRRDVHSQGDICRDTDGGVWLQVPHAVLRAKGERIAAGHSIPGAGPLRCALDPEGGLWLALGNMLHRADSQAIRLVAAPRLPDEVEVLSLLRDSESRLWIGGEDVVCAGALAGRDTIAGWDCARLPAAGLVLALHETPSGSIWAATSRRGVFTLRDGAWRPAAGNAMLPSTSLLNLIPSRAGGVWVLGHGVVWRVEESADAAWVVRERLGEWHGLPLESGRDLHEDADGTLWITTSLGVIEVPSSARTPPGQPPAVELVKALIDEQPVALGDTLELPFQRNRLELHFAVLSFRDPGRLRYQVRLSPDGEWREATGRPWFRWIDIQPRRHLAELRASLDGEHWTVQPASLAFRVRPPWYRTAWAVAALAAAASLLLWAAYRARVGYLIGLERERTRIAMDLHDEMGSGLGSIGILSGLLASRGLDDGRNRDLASRIARTAQDLGGSLSGIIWSLDARPSTLAELASRLAEAGGNLLAAQGIEFCAEFPDAWPPDALSPRARRNLMLLGLEALHNAARHSKARSVTLAVRHAGAQWEMRIADDGTGFDAALPHGGHGLGTIRRRAEEIGASIAWDTHPGQGTAVVVRFTLRSIRARPSSGAFEAPGAVRDSRPAPVTARHPDRIAGGPA
jgi:signal transduction histidine kinase/ligand-binding sensor domain-containing protein